MHFLPAFTKVSHDLCYNCHCQMCIVNVCCEYCEEVVCEFTREGGGRLWPCLDLPLSLVLTPKDKPFPFRGLVVSGILL